MAAEKLGLVKLISENHTVLTSFGEYFIRQNNDVQNNIIKNEIMKLPVFSDAIYFIENEGEAHLKDWFVEKYPGEQSTAERRFSTFVKYLKFCGY